MQGPGGGGLRGDPVVHCIDKGGNVPTVVGPLSAPNSDLGVLPPSQRAAPAAPGHGARQTDRPVQFPNPFAVKTGMQIHCLLPWDNLWQIRGNSMTHA